MPTESIGRDQPMTVEGLLAEHSPPVARVARQVRRTVRAAMPESEERVYPGWHGIGYHHPDVGYVCGIFPRRDEVRLGFEHGHLLSDPDHVLVSGGKQVRYLVIERWSPELRQRIVDFMRQAVPGL